MQSQGTFLPLLPDCFLPRADCLRRIDASLGRTQCLRKRILQLGRSKILKRTRATTLWKCELDADNSVSETSSQTEKVTEQAVSVSSVPSNIGSTSSGNTVGSVNLMEGPNKTTNSIIALASAGFAVGLFLFTRAGFSGATLGELAASATPYEEALSNGRPTVVEFYADWCEVCREMAPDVYKVEQEYKGLVNFVMLNVDNGKWEQELDEFGVEGIPHFAFLDQKGNEEGNIVGRLPKKYLEDNISALAKGEEKIPHTRIVGQFSSAESRQAPPVVEPRSHGT